MAPLKPARCRVDSSHGFDQATQGRRPQLLSRIVAADFQDKLFCFSSQSGNVERASKIGPSRASKENNRGSDQLSMGKFLRINAHALDCSTCSTQGARRVWGRFHFPTSKTKRNKLKLSLPTKNRNKQPKNDGAAPGIRKGTVGNVAAQNQCRNLVIARGTQSRNSEFHRGASIRRPGKRPQRLAV